MQQSAEEQQRQQQQRQQRVQTLLPVCFGDGTIIVGDGLVAVDAVTEQASVRHAGNITVLSIKAKDGPASIEDVTFGKFMLLELEDDTYAIILPLIDRQTYRGTLRPPR
ncbi:hypothetical protein N2152v2_004646 [Parachlorella kessleri]